MTNRLKGVTLVETMLYIGIFSVIIVIIINFMLSTQEATRRNNIESSFQRTSSFISQHLDDSFNSITSINESSSVFNNEQGVLDLLSSTGNKRYNISNSRLLFNNIPITPTDISVTSFLLTPIYKDPSSLIGVKISIILNSKKDTSLSQTINLLEIVR